MKLTGRGQGKSNVIIGLIDPDFLSALYSKETSRSHIKGLLIISLFQDGRQSVILNVKCVKVNKVIFWGLLNRSVSIRDVSKVMSPPENTEEYLCKKTTLKFTHNLDR